ncbi:hypothetical protein AB0D94_33865 [Streptomyces sp. NPDC048255]|uniref:hypothetical protein n=1 Tax=Streptomyces sp. NPDC048255 TaxID=3154713 RepID=UPI0033DA4D70
MNAETSSRRRALAVALVSTLLTVATAAAALLLVGLSPMACDSCDAEATDRFEASLTLAYPVFVLLLLMVLPALVVTWLLPWSNRKAARRISSGLAAPSFVLLAVLAFVGLVEWP